MSCTPINQTMRWPQRPVARAMIVVLMVATPALMTPSPSQASTSPPRSQASAGAPCSRITVTGRAIVSNGTVLKRHYVAVGLKGASTWLQRGVRTNRKGGFKFAFCRSQRLARYARRHGGRINYKIGAAANGSTNTKYVKHVARPYSMDRLVPPGPMRAVMVYSRNSSARLVTGEYDIRPTMAYPELARLQAVRFMHAEVDINYSSVQAISSEVKLEQGGFGISGSMVAATSGESGETQTLYATTKHPKVATKIEPQVALSANYACDAPIVGPGQIRPSTGDRGDEEPTCYTETDAVFTGDNTRRVPAVYTGCRAGSTPVSHFTNRELGKVYNGGGAEFTSEAAVKFGIATLTFKTEYSREHHVTDFFDANTKHKHRFCLSGDGQHLSDSGRLFVGLRDGNGDGSCGGTGRRTQDRRGPACR